MKKTSIIGILFIFCLFNIQCVDAKSVTVYAVPTITDDKILPSSEISSSYISDTISVKASPGEFEPASFVIRADEDIESVIIDIDNLTGSNGEIQSTNIDIRTVKCWYQGGYELYNNNIIGRYLTPELLLKDESLIYVEGEEWPVYDMSNPGGRNYLKVDGSYIDISDDSTKYTSYVITPISERPIKDATTLQPVTLRQNMNKQFWVTVHIPEDTQPGNYIGTITARVGNTLLSTIKLDVTVLPITLSDPYLEYSIYYKGRTTTDGTGSISSESKTTEQLTAELQDMFDHGVTNPCMFISDTSRLTLAYSIRQQIGMNNSNLYTVWLSLNDVAEIDRVKSVTAPYGVKEVYVYGYDERPLTDPETIEKIKAIHAAGGKVLNAQYPDQAYDIATHLDLATVPFSPDPDLAALYHKNGNRIFSYGNPQTVPEYPRAYRRNFGLLLWQKDYDGAMDYAYQHSYGDIWNDFDYEGGTYDYRDHVFAYPTMNGVIDTIQWEGFREGVDDVRYLTTLQNTIILAKSQGKDTTAAENYLANLKKSDLSSQDLDVVRGEMINHILSLQDQPNPMAEFSADSTSGPKPLTVQFTDLSEKATAWYWDFDNDGNVDSTGQSPSYTYESSGTYTVNLTVSNAGGSDSEVKTDYISVSESIPSAPVAAFSATPTSGYAPLAVQFTDASDDTVSSWQWDFDNDGSVDSTEQNPSHTYTGEGTYTVTLTVKDTDGNTGSDTCLVTVLNKPSDTIVSISPSSNHITPGETFTLDVLVDPSIPITGAQFDHLFDSSMATADSVTEGNLFNQDGAETFFSSGAIDNTAGKVENIYGSILGGSSVSSSGAMATITMTAGSNTGIAELDLSNVIVSDSGSNAVPITINNATVLIDTAPVLNSIGPKSVSETETLTLTVDADDADGNDLSYSAAGLPDGASFDTAAGVFTWTPSTGQSGVYTVTFEVSDGYLSNSEDVSITVNPANNVPVIDSFEPENGANFKEKDKINISVSAFDSDGQLLSYTIKIDGVTCSTEPSYIWKTGYSSSGEHTVEVTVSDGIDQVIEQHTIYVNDYHPSWDVNKDWKVNILDVAIVSQKYGTTTTEPYPRWDVTQDGTVNIQDLSVVGYHFGEIIE